MKNNNVLVYFVAVITLIAVYFVARGLTNYWEDDIAGARFNIENQTIESVCRDYDGDGEWKTRIATRSGETTERPIFVCRIY